jgi:hypothetical protein
MRFMALPSERDCARMLQQEERVWPPLRRDLGDEFLLQAPGPEIVNLSEPGDLKTRPRSTGLQTALNMGQ